MVARGDLGMEIPSEKVSLAQKMLITKCNIAGKFVITATQMLESMMLESMVKNPLPTRAEMTDVANAVFDGTDAVMLSGETANGSFPETAVEIMANIAKQAETGINYYQVGAFVRDFTPRPFGTVEAVLSSVAKNAIDIGAGLIVVFSENGHAARLIAKYHPCVPVTP
ncbi:pyruvate kinase [Baffinella frigidus]|nr:pyruvate kinase [Cryptophyta sp. CCMP2293]